MLRAGFDLLGILAVALFGAAVLVGRLAPAPARASVAGRTPATPRFTMLKGAFSPAGTARLLDLATGEACRSLSGSAMSFDYPACSPWRDARGRWQVVAAWHRQVGADGGDPSISGLARFSYPEGRLIDRVGLPMLPGGASCWLPGRAARVVFPGTDGALYRFDFEEADGTPSRAGRPRPLRWLCDRPGGAWCFFDPSCPAALPGGPWIVVASYGGDPRPGGDRRVDLCWLRLSGGGGAVLQAGRLTPSEVDGATDALDYRYPVVASDGGGRWSLAYLCRREGEAPWSVCVAPLSVDASAGVPRVAWGAAQWLAAGAAMNAPALSLDGRHVLALMAREGGRATVVRLPNPLASSGSLVRSCNGG